MVTVLQIRNIRLSIDDPAGFIDIIQVSSLTDLPISPAQQTVYNVISNGWYVATKKTNGAVPGDYVQQSLYISDASIDRYVTEHGESKAIPFLIMDIMSKLSNECIMQSTSTGSESKTYTSLTSRLAFYEKLLQKYQDQSAIVTNNSTGRHFKTHNPCIAGGNI